MSNDELYYDDLTNLAERIKGGLQNRTQPLSNLTDAFNQLLSTNTIKGKATDNMKAYINEVHMTLIQALQLLLNNYEMALGKYVKGYLGVDSNENFKLVREDLEDHVSNLTSHRSDFTSLGDQLTTIASEVEDIVELNGAGGYRLYTTANEMDVMKKTASDLKDSWDKYEQTDPGFNQVLSLIAQTKSLIQSTLHVARGDNYNPGSFANLMSQGFMQAFQASMAFANDPANQKAFQKDWASIGKDYATDQKRIQKAKLAQEKERNRWNGLFTVLGAVVGALAIAATVATCGLAAPLLVAGIAFTASDAIEGADQTIEGDNQGFNPLRWLAEKGSEKVTGSKEAGDIIYGSADFAVGIMTGNDEGKALEVGKYGQAFVSTIKTSSTLDKFQTGVKVIDIATDNGITGNIQNTIYNTTYSEWHNVALSSVLSHSTDIASDVSSGKESAKDVAAGTINHTLKNASAKTAESVTRVFASQTNQRANLAKVVGR